jgi:hypothetical protein
VRRVIGREVRADLVRSAICSTAGELQHARPEENDSEDDKRSDTE